MKKLTAADRQRATMDAWYTLIEAENEKNSFINKFFDATPDVNDTASLAIEYSKEIDDMEEKRFTYSMEI